MKKLLVILSLVTSFTGLYADNLLTNPSFETAGDSPDVALGWLRWGDWMNRESEWTPTHSGKCLIGYHHWQITTADNSGLWQNISNAKAGQKFKFSVFVYIDPPNGSDNPPQKIELRLEATRDGQQVAIHSETFKLEDIPKDSNWHELSVTGTTPVNNLRVLIIVTPAAKAPRGGAVKFDDASVELQ